MLNELARPQARVLYAISPVFLPGHIQIKVKWSLNYKLNITQIINFTHINYFDNLPYYFLEKGLRLRPGQVKTQKRIKNESKI